MQEALTAWAAEGWRDLPWRRTRDPWAVLVSEVMLQQTQVSRVIPKWTAFMVRWPTVAACAAAPAADVVREWRGLGYNRRALSLHRCAEAVVADHDGRIPVDLRALLSLPGIGAYTARAIQAFAYGQDVAVVDINAARVVTRAVAGRRTALAETQRMADALLPPGRGWAWNQAMLDLGAQVCTARSPRCEVCPLAGSCAWRRAGGDDPAEPRYRQSRFVGSDRQGRGRLVDALRHGPVQLADIATACGWPESPGRAAVVAAAIVEEGFAVEVAGTLRLSQS